MFGDKGMNPSEILAGELARLNSDIKTLDANMQKLHNHFSVWVENVDMIAFAALMMLVNDGKYELNEDTMKKVREKIDDIAETLKKYREELQKDSAEEKPKIIKTGKKRGRKIITK